MELDIAFHLACDLMVEHVGEGLFKWDNSKSTMGQALVTPAGDKILYLSRPLTLANDEDLIRDVILHEIAHILTWEQDDEDIHGPIWLAKFKQLEGSGNIEYDANDVPWKWELHCPQCGNFLKGWYRKPKVCDGAMYACTHLDCGKEGLTLKQVR